MPSPEIGMVENRPNEILTSRESNVLKTSGVRNFLTERETTIATYSRIKRSEVTPIGWDPSIAYTEFSTPKKSPRQSYGTERAIYYS